MLTHIDILTRGCGLWVSSKKLSWLSFTGLPAGGFTRVGATYRQTASHTQQHTRHQDKWLIIKNVLVRHNATHLLIHSSAEPSVTWRLEEL